MDRIAKCFARKFFNANLLLRGNKDRKLMLTITHSRVSLRLTSLFDQFFL